MDAIIRFTESLDWISITIFLCVLSIAIVRQFSTLSLVEFLSVYSSSRFIKITQDGRIDNYQSYQLVGIIIYSVTIALLLFKLASLNEEQVFTDFILILTAVSAFLLFKHYVSKLISTVSNFEEMLVLVDHQRNLYRAVLSVTLMLAVILNYYVYPNNQAAILITTLVAGSLVLLYHILLIYSHRTLLFSSFFYFILYLCTLEIAPYMLLYKYFTA